MDSLLHCSSGHFKKNNNKNLHTKFGANQTYSDQVMVWTNLLNMKIKKGNNPKIMNGPDKLKV
jgi:hypothetical protein